jgi:hypothetical protein
VGNVAFGDYTLYRCLVTCPCGTLTTAPAGLFSSGPPVALYRFTLPDPAADLSGNNFNGALGAVVTGTTFGCSGFLRFLPDNNVDEFTVPHAPALDMVGAMTGMAWIRPLGPHSSPGDISCPEGTIFSKGGNYWFQVSQNNSQLEFQNEGSGNYIVSAPASLPLNTWTHVAFVRQTDKRTIRFFVNGVLIATHTLGIDPGGNTDPLMIGNHGFGNSPAHCEFNGDIDEIVLIDRALTDTEVQRAYQCTCNPGAPNWAPSPRRYPAAVAQTAPVLPLHATPSPMLEHTTFEFQLDQPRAMRLEIFDVSGRHVRLVTAGIGNVGTNTVGWDGCDDGHRPVGAGIYLVRMSAGDVSQWSRIVVVR